MRNATTQAERGMETISRHRDLMSNELQQLYDIAKEGGVINNRNLFNALTTAFYFGFMVGHRQGLATKKERQNNGNKES